MFTSRIPIPYPPPGCTTAYVQNNRALVVPIGASLPHICVQCGIPSDVVVKRIFHWPQPEPDPFPHSYRAITLTPILDEIEYMFRWLFRLDTRITLEVPLCSEHLGEEKTWHWLGAMMFLVGSALLSLIFIPRAIPYSLRGLAWFGTYIMLLGGSSLAFSEMNTLHVVEVNTAYSAYEGFGAGYMKQMPHEFQIFPPKHGAALDPPGESDRRKTQSTPTFSTDLL